jgi:hypothetical protein
MKKDGFPARARLRSLAGNFPARAHLRSLAENDKF